MFYFATFFFFFLLLLPLMANKVVCVCVFSGVHRIPARDRRTDKRTDILLLHSPRYAYALRGSNDLKYFYEHQNVNPFIGNRGQRV